jgi:hypothetical protein
LDNPRHQFLTTCTNLANSGLTDVTNNLTKSFYSQFARCDQVSNTISQSSSPGRCTATHDISLLLRFLNSQQPNVLSQLPVGVTFQVDSQCADQAVAYIALHLFVDSIDKNLAAIEQKQEAKREARENQKTKELSLRRAIAVRNESKKLKAKARAQKIQDAIAKYKSEGRCEIGLGKKIVMKHNPDADWGAGDDEAFIQVKVDPLQVLMPEPELEPEYVVQRRVSPLYQSHTPEGMAKEEEEADGWGW